jgi:LacI family transcriptional regulator, galactose operon repressor
MKNATINDIAKKLGISPSTVSRALNEHPKINVETKLRVKRVAKKLNYVPNPIAISLKNNTTTVIGVIVPEIMHDFFASAISGIEEVAYHSGYTIIVSQSNESFYREILNTNSLLQQRVAGLIVSISQTTKNGKHFQSVLERGIPLVFFDRSCKDISVDKVIIDDFKGAFDAVKFLIDKGYKRIAHIGGPVNLEICMLRLSGYQAALEKSRIKVEKDLIFHGDLHESHGYKTVDYMLKKNKMPDAIFAANDPIAVGAYQRLKEAGLKIPDNIGIVGFSNNKITGLLDPGLTTVNQPAFDMGKKAAEILINKINNRRNRTRPETFVLPTELVVRGSA